MRLTAPTKINQKAGDEALLDLIVIDMQPLQIVENEGFIAYTKKLNPDYILPSRKKLTKMLEDRYNLCSVEVKAKLEGVKDIALTTDIWSSDGQNAFISTTAHFVKDASLHSLVISTTELSEQHTAINIANALRAIMTEWQIYDKVVTIVTDNASNMKKAVQDYLQKRNHFCVAHTLNLAVKDCINKDNDQPQSAHLKNEEVLQVITKSRTIVTHFKQSIKSSNSLREMQSQMNLDIIKLKQDVQTRWNSTFYMFERLLKVKVPLSATLSILDSPPPNLDAAQWQILEDSVTILQPFEKITAVLSAESYPTLSCIIPLVRGLQNSLNKRTPITEAGKHLQRALEVVDKRLSVYESNRTAAKATLLDPRFKKKAFGLDNMAENEVKYVTEELAYYITREPNYVLTEPPVANTSATNVPPLSNADEIWEDFDRKLTESVMQQTPISSATTLLKQYLDLPYLDRKQDPLQFWAERQQLFPSLCQMAFKYLCIPAFSVPSERLFSKADSSQRETLFDHWLLVFEWEKQQ
ncbi:E3 SUMO-protein ligase ZBED1 [Cydia strobilella]|uniref:E3 SUMO-protein ligase ZBED1 n=1 Tax=Cydia strobilella TaxID=1100964 RepID=UPI00300454FB